MLKPDIARKQYTDTSAFDDGTGMARAAVPKLYVWANKTQVARKKRAAESDAHNSFDTFRAGIGDDSRTCASLIHRPATDTNFTGSAPWSEWTRSSSSSLLKFCSIAMVHQIVSFCRGVRWPFEDSLDGVEVCDASLLEPHPE